MTTDAPTSVVPTTPLGRAVTVSLVNDYDVVVAGLAAMLAPFADRVQVVDLEVCGTPDRRADVALFDTFGGRRHAIDRAGAMVRDGLVDHVVLYTWDVAPAFAALAERVGVHGILSKTLSASEVVDALEAIAAGERPGLAGDGCTRRARHDPTTEPLSEREREVLALVAQGRTNREIADELFLSPETIKTYLRRIFAKLDVSNRAQAAVHAVSFGLGDPSA